MTIRVRIINEDGPINGKCVRVSSVQQQGGENTVADLTVGEHVDVFVHSYQCILVEEFNPTIKEIAE